MSPSGPDEPLTSELIDQRLDRLFAAPPAAGKAQPLDDPYLVAAALRSTFEPEQLVAGSNPDPDRLRTVLERSIVVEDADGRLTWCLRNDARREALATLGGREAVLEAARTYAAPGDRLQAAIVAQLEGRAAPVAEQSPEQLARTLQALELLGELGDGPAQAGSVRSRLDRELLLEPFRYLVGDHFAGREDELQTLSDYVGVLGPRSVKERARRIARGAAGFLTEPPLVVSGAGGIGKSSLLAKFVLNHTHDGGSALPFAYLDFDRSSLNAADPTTILVEAARQLAIQAGESRDAWEAGRRRWASTLTMKRQASPIVRGQAPGYEADRLFQRSVIDEFAELLDLAFEPGSPFLLVLDTFEEVQFRSRTYVAALWDFLEALQARVHRLRTVIAGRAPISEHDTKDLEMPMLDEDAAAGYLHMRGVADPKTARFIVSRFGGNPLTLRLAADIVQQDIDGVDTLRGVKGRQKVLKLLSASQETIQRALYNRILAHIHDDNVRALAHPGLTLRRITSDLIVEVLAEPCGIDVQSSGDADQLLEGLRREVSLVRTSDDGGVEHRSDLRRLMLPMLYADHPIKVGVINDRAVVYYGARDGVSDRAEEIYHRLARGDDPEDVDSRWVEGVGDYLVNAVQELSVRAQAYLAPRVGIELDDDVLREASRRDHELVLARRGRELLAVGDAPQAMKLLEDAVSELGAGGELGLLLARAQHRLGQHEAALATIDRALEELPHDAEMRLVLELQELAAQIEDDRGDFEQAAERLEEAYTVASWLREVGSALALGAGWLHVTRDVNPEQLPRVAAEVNDLLERQTDDVLRTDPELAWALAGELGDLHPVVLERVGHAVAYPVDLPEAGVGEVLKAWAASDPAAAALMADAPPRSTRTTISALFVLLDTGPFPDRAAELMARLLRERWAALNKQGGKT